MSRTILTPLLTLLAIATAPLTAGAQSAYPDKAVRSVSGFPPGTTADVIARVLAPKMAETLGQISGAISRR